jgi:lysozyme family protein
MEVEMYTIRFDEAFKLILGHEGGYVNDPQDPGGETNWGISKRAYPHVNMRLLTVEGAKEIYYRDYWNVMRCEELPNKVAINLFDAAVNHGVHRAAIFLQQTVHVADDGVIGPITVRTILETDPEVIVMRFNALRLMFYTKLSKWPRFGAGWVNRVARNLLLE